MKMTMTDQYSVRADARRGYHDYECKLVFEESAEGSSLTEEGQKRYAEHIAKLFAATGGPTWCHGPKKIAENTWVINHGYDSGD